MAVAEAAVVGDSRVDLGRRVIFVGHPSSVKSVIIQFENC